MTRKDAKVIMEALKDILRALLTQYVHRQDVTSVFATELVTSTVLLEHFGAKLDTMAKELDFDI